MSRPHAPDAGATVPNLTSEQSHQPKLDILGRPSNSANAHKSRPLPMPILKPSATVVRQIEPEALRIPDAVRFTSLSRSRLFEMLAAGTLRRVKHGRVTLIPVADLRALISVTD